MSKIADLLSVSRNHIADYLLYIEEAGMIAQLRSQTGGIRGLAKIDKVFLDNSNLSYALSSEQPNLGSIRETFFFEPNVRYPRCAQLRICLLQNWAI